MHRLQLKHCLEAAGVAEDKYLVVGVDPPHAVSEGACILRPNERSWEVLVWRPSRSQPPLSFLSEDDACEYVLDTLTAGLAAAQRTSARDADGRPDLLLPAMSDDPGEVSEPEPLSQPAPMRVGEGEAKEAVKDRAVVVLP